MTDETILPGPISAIQTLMEFLAEKLEDYDVDIIEEFPNHNDELEYPTISVITAGTPEYMHFMPYILSQSDNEDDSNKIDNIYAVGQYDMNIQLDVWVKYKADRETWLKLIMDTLDYQFLNGDNPTGLSLELNNYYSVIARYDQISYNYLDGEESSQRDEWRIQFNLVSSFVRAVEKTEPKIIQATITHEIGTEETNEREDTQIF